MTSSRDKNPSQEEINTLISYYQSQNYGEAENLALILKRNFPSHPLSLKILCSIFHKKGKINEALDLYNNLLKLTPYDHEIHFNLGNLLKSIGELVKAEQSYKKAIELKPNFKEVFCNLGILEYELGKLEESETNLSKAIELSFDFLEAHFHLGNVLRSQGRLKDAEKSFIRAISFKPDYIEAFNNLGLTLKDQGKFEEAIQVYKKALEIKPGYIGAEMNIEKIIQNIVPAWHINMMNDEFRNKAFLDAIKLAVNEDTLVFEIGTGSGLLSMMAIESGAKKVVTCESVKTIADNAVKIINKNGYQKKIKIVNKKSTDVKIGRDIPCKADLLIAEILSSEFVGEGVKKSILDANQRLLKENGKVIPQSGCIKIALLGDTEEIKKSIYVNNSSGFDLSLFNSISQRKFTLKLKEKPKILSDAVDAFTFDLENLKNYSIEEKSIRLQANQDGLCLGLIQWIKLKLYDEIEYENIPYKVNSHWGTPIYVFDKPVELKKGQFIDIKGFLADDSLWFSKVN